MKRTFDQLIKEDLDNQTEDYIEKNKNNNNTLNWLYDHYIVNNRDLQKEFITIMGKQGLDYDRGHYNSCLPNQAIITTVKLLNKYKLIKANELNKKFRDQGCEIRIIDYNIDNEDKRDYELIEC